MWPVLFRIGSFEVTTFGLMMFVAFAVGAWVMMREFRRLGLDPEAVGDIVAAAAIGGIVGGKLYYAILYGDLSLLFARAGLVWYGGLLGGFLAATAVVYYKKLDFRTVADAGAPGLAIGYALGRIGCFLVGDDYGKPTDSVFGIAFPEGAPPTTARSLRQFGVDVDPALPGDTLLAVHPTQLYTAAAFFLIFWILIKAGRRPNPPGFVWALFLILLGAERLLIEFFRAKDDRFFGELTLAQIISFAVILVGVGLLMRVRRKTPETVG
ncbi:MAG: prolipoprotein diacylglyceryl transferase [Acidobacteria bacterium]|nr:prolipoprotein diacylglyceryl transferase [Acidobacteriota bacterium]